LKVQQLLIEKLYLAPITFSLLRGIGAPPANKKGHLEEHCEFTESIYQKASQLVLTQSFKFCATCHSNIEAGRKPKGAISNGLHFQEILHFLEERLIFPRLPFMIIKSIGHERQSAVKEVFINVPICDDPPTSFQ